MPTELPAQWRWTRIGQHFKRVRRKNSASVDRVLTASGTHGLVDQRDFFNRRVAAAKTDHYYHLKRGEFAYNRSAMNGYPFGAIKRLDEYEEGALSTLYICFALRPEAEVDSDFSAFLFDSDQLDDELGAICAVGARAHGLLNVTPSDFFEVSFPLPPLAEQRKIATILSNVDDAITATRKVIEQTKRVKQGLLQTLMTRGIGHTRFKKTEIGEIPEGWGVTKLESIASISSGGTPSRSRPEYFGGRIPWVKSGELVERITSTEDSLTESGLKNSAAKIVPAGTTLVAMYGATAGAVGRLTVPAATNQAIASLEPIAIDGDFLFYAVTRGATGLLRNTQGSGQPNLNQGMVRRMRIPLPPKAEQAQIARLIDEVAACERIENQQLMQQNNLKRGLMQNLLTGRVRVPQD